MVLVSIDRIGVVLNLINEEYGAVCSGLWDMAGEPGYEVWKNDKQCWTKAAVSLGENQSLRLHVGISHHKGFIKIDYNPASLTKPQWQELAMQLGFTLEDGYSTLYAHGRVSYLEIAADFHGIEWGGLLPFDSRLQNSNWYPPYPASKATAYLGRRGSTRVIRTYDRVEKQKAQGILTMNGPVTRVEAVLRRLQRLIPELHTVKSPFETVGFCDCNAAMNAFTEQQWKTFVQNCKWEGTSKALALIGPLKKTYLKRLQSLNVSWWNPAAVWSQYPQALQILKAPIALCP